MSAGTQLRTQWQGRVVEGKFPLLRELGKSNHSSVFLTDYGEQEPQKAAIKLIPLDAVERAYGNKEDAQLARWKEAAGISHPHLIKLLDFGRCQIQSIRFLYVVTEYAEENLGEILPVRPLSPDEALEMLRPAAAALDTLHRAGFVHGNIKPSNILAVNDQLKISIDGISRAGERGSAPSAYDPPEKAATGVSKEGDVWSLSRTLLVVLTQKEPETNAGVQASAIPTTIPKTVRDIAETCLRSDPQQRGTAADILRRLDPDRVPLQASGGESRLQESFAIDHKKPMAVIISAVLVLVAALAIGRLLRHNPAVPEANNSQSAAASTGSSAADSAPPFSKKQEGSPSGPTRGSVLHQVMPEVSPGALKTIGMRIRVSVQVDVDSSGSVSSAKLVHSGPSRYFADRALAAARKWKFNPPRNGEQATGSEWMLRFQFRRSNIEVTPSEIRP
jgi:TonB family protein